MVTLVGRNGAGKTTLLRCVMGLHRQRHGRVMLLDGADVTTLPAHREPAPGSAGSPTTGGSTPASRVEENLTLPPVVRADRLAMERVYDVFPVLKERRRRPADKLSGGEQQMLAIARVLRIGARVLLCDEPTEGLAPVVVQRIGEILREVKRHGVGGAARRAERTVRHDRRRPPLPARPGRGSSSARPTTRSANARTNSSNYLGM